MRRRRWRLPVQAAALLLVSQLCSAACQLVGDAGGPPSSSCPSACGDVKVPYPFGIRDGCFLPGFNLTCDQTQHPPRLLLGTLQVVEISLINYTVRAMDTPGGVNITSYGEKPPNHNGTWNGLLGGGSSNTYILSEKHNQLVVTGCNVQGMLLGNNRNVIIGCSSFCSIGDNWADGTRGKKPYRGRRNGGGRVLRRRLLPDGHPHRPPLVRRPVKLPGLGPQLLNYQGVLPEAVLIAERGWFDSVAAQR